MENLGVLFFYYIEVGMALAFLGPALFGIRPGAKKVVLMGIIQGVAIYLARNLLSMLKFPPFVHSLVLLVSLIIIIKVVTGTGWGIASAGSILGNIIIIASEMIVVPILWPRMGLSFEKFISSPSVHIMTGYLAESPLFILAIIVGVTKFSFIKPGDDR